MVLLAKVRRVVLAVLLAGCGQSANDGTGAPADAGHEGGGTGGAGDPAPAAGTPTTTAPDVILIVIDTLRADRTAALACELDAAGALSVAAQNTPSLAALGASGAVYRQAVAPAAWTLPSMAALFAGRDVAESRRSAFPDAPTLAERLQRAGWRTLGLVANPLLTQDNGFARGFLRFEVAPASGPASRQAGVQALRAWDAEALVQRALGWLEAENRNVPVFLYLHLMDPHVLYDPRNESLAPPDPGWSDAVRADPSRADAVPLRAWTAALEPDAITKLGAWRRAYDSQVRFADAALGRLFARLPEVRGRPCLIAVTSDHGEGLFTHVRDADSPALPGPLGGGYPDHGEQLYEESLRVPLWLAGPGVPPGFVEPRAVTTASLAPTLLALAGLDDLGVDDAGLDDLGLDDAGLDEAGPRDAERVTVASDSAAPRLPLAASDSVPDQIFGVGTRGWCVRSATHKLTVPFPERRDRPGVAPRLDAVEPGGYAPELQDLSALEPTLLATLATALQRWVTATAVLAVEPVDPATEERLRALGYVR